MPWLKKEYFLGVMIFFAAGDPEENCHEKCQQLGDGNGKPDTVRAVFFVDGFAVPVYGKGYVMKYGDKYLGKEKQSKKEFERASELRKIREV